MSDPDLPPVARVPVPSTVAQAVQFAAEAIDRAREAGHRELMVVAAALEGAPPSLSARHQIIRSWAEAAQGKVTLALVVPPAYIDPDKFGVVTARNFGLRGDVFSDEAEAAEWLRLHR